MEKYFIYFLLAGIGCTLIIVIIHTYISQKILNYLKKRKIKKEMNK